MCDVLRAHELREGGHVPRVDELIGAQDNSDVLIYGHVWIPSAASQAWPHRFAGRGVEGSQRWRIDRLAVGARASRVEDRARAHLAATAMPLARHRFAGAGAG